MALRFCHSEREAVVVFAMEQAPLFSIDEAAEVAPYHHTSRQSSSLVYSWSFPAAWPSVEGAANLPSAVPNMEV